MDKLEKQMIDVVNRNHQSFVIYHDCRMLAERLNAISARRKRRGKK